MAGLSDTPLEVEAAFFNKKYTWAYGTQAAHVAVDPGTGHVKVIDYLSVEDVGRMINPLTLHGQAIGSIVQGLGGAFLEHLVYDENGQLLTGSFADYLLPTASDFPNIRSITLELKPCPNNPLGAKGAGEGGLIPVGGIMANAVADALSHLNVQPMELPLSPPRIWQLVERRGGCRKLGSCRIPAACNKNSQRVMLCAATRLAASSRAAPTRRIPIQLQLTEQSIVTYLRCRSTTAHFATRLGR